MLSLNRSLHEEYEKHQIGNSMKVPRRINYGTNTDSPIRAPHYFSAGILRARYSCKITFFQKHTAGFGYTDLEKNIFKMYRALKQSLACYNP